MKASASDRNLLLGMIALQMDFINRDQLIDAMHAWVLEKPRPLSEILVDRGALQQGEQAALEALVERHISRHGGDARESLSSISTIDDLHASLAPINDPEIRASLSNLTAARQPSANGSNSATLPYTSNASKDCGRYQILRLHDQGGIGAVFLAVDTDLNRQVALKQLRQETICTEQDRVRFVQEAEITGNLEHPGVVPVYEKGQFSDGRPYYAMRFIRGENLKIAIAALHGKGLTQTDPDEWRRTFHSLLRRFLAVCETIAYAHDRGVLHRDLKPHNILLGPYGETLVVDWGLAKVVGRNEPEAREAREDATVRPPSGSNLDPTLAGSRVGTPAYMSPEQARGEVDCLTFATDVYSLGATLYELLCGQPPFPGKERSAVYTLVCLGQLVPPRDVNPSVDRAMNAICLKAMALSPDDRYLTPRALAEDIERWLADLPVQAYADPPTRQFRRWVRRHRPLVASAAVLLVTSLIGLSFLTWRLSRENTRVERARQQAGKQLEMTRKAVRELLNASGSTLATLPGSDALQSELATITLSMLDEISGLYPKDRRVLFERAQVLRILANIAESTGDTKVALENFTQAIDFHRSLLTDASLNAEARRWLAYAQMERGEFFHEFGQLRRAEEDFRNAMSDADLISPSDHHPVVASLKPMILVNRSEVYLLLNRNSEALADANEAVKLLQPLINPPSSNPPDPNDLWVYAIALTDKGVATARLGNRDAGEVEIRNAIAATERIPPSSSSALERTYQSAVAFSQLAQLHEDAPDRFPMALASYGRAVQALESLVSQFPFDTYYLSELASALSGRARVAFALGKFSEAENDITAARSTVERLLGKIPDFPDGLSSFSEITALEGLNLLRRSRPEEARACVENLTNFANKLRTLDPDRQIDAPSVKMLKAKLGVADARNTG